MGSESNTNTYVVPLSLIGFFEEQAALNYFIQAGMLTKFSAWCNKTQLLTQLQQFCVTNHSKKDFKLKCSELFPELLTMPDEKFFNIWRDMCVLATNVEARIANIRSLLEAGHTVLIVGNVDHVQLDAIRTMLHRFRFSIPDQGLSCYTGTSGEALLRGLLKGQTNKKIYFFSPPPPPLPYENWGLLKWVFAPFDTFFCYRKRNEIQAFFELTDSEHQLIQIPVQPDGDLIHQLPGESEDFFLSHENSFSPYYHHSIANFSAPFSPSDRSNLSLNQPANRLK